MPASHPGDLLKRLDQDREIRVACCGGDEAPVGRDHRNLLRQSQRKVDTVIDRMIERLSEQQRSWHHVAGRPMKAHAYRAICSLAAGLALPVALHLVVARFRLGRQLVLGLR